MTKYKTDKGRFGVNAQIIAVEVDRETAHNVWINGIKNLKETTWEIYHSSWEEAHSYLIDRGNQNVKNVKKRLESEKERLKKVEEMVKP